MSFAISYGATEAQAMHKLRTRVYERKDDIQRVFNRFDSGTISHAEFVQCLQDLDLELSPAFYHLVRNGLADFTLPQLMRALLEPSLAKGTPLRAGAKSAGRDNTPRGIRTESPSRRRDSLSAVCYAENPEGAKTGKRVTDIDYRYSHHHMLQHQAQGPNLSPNDEDSNLALRGIISDFCTGRITAEDVVEQFEERGRPLSHEHVAFLHHCVKQDKRLFKEVFLALLGHRQPMLRPADAPAGVQREFDDDDGAFRHKGPKQLAQFKPTDPLGIHDVVDEVPRPKSGKKTNTERGARFRSSEGFVSAMDPTNYAEHDARNLRRRAPPASSISFASDSRESDGERRSGRRYFAEANSARQAPFANHEGDMALPLDDFAEQTEDEERVTEDGVSLSEQEAELAYEAEPVRRPATATSTIVVGRYCEPKQDRHVTFATPAPAAAPIKVPYAWEERTSPVTAAKTVQPERLATTVKDTPPSAKEAKLVVSNSKLSGENLENLRAKFANVVPAEPQLEGQPVQFETDSTSNRTLAKVRERGYALLERKLRQGIRAYVFDSAHGVDREVFFIGPSTDAIYVFDQDGQLVTVEPVSVLKSASSNSNFHSNWRKSSPFATSFTAPTIDNIRAVAGSRQMKEEKGLPSSVYFRRESVCGGPSLHGSPSIFYRQS